MPLAILLAAMFAQVTPSAEEARVRALAQPVIDQFHAAVARCGARPPFKPTIRVENGAGMIHYRPSAGQVVLYPWSTMTEKTKANFETYAQQPGGDGDARATYEQIFNELLVAHELGHWLQPFQPEKRNARGIYDNWRYEYNANQLMVAFWRENPARERPTEMRLARYLGYDDGKPNKAPPPIGESIENYFSSSTQAIVKADAYGWYQNVMGRRAVAERPKPSFCRLVSEWLPLK